MPAAAGSTLDRDAVEAVVALASSAPSLHNTQPWQWQLQQGVLDLRADRSRQLRVADPDGHSLHVSCGAAAELTQLALAAQGWAVDASLLPDPADPDLLARFHPTSRGEPNAEAAQRSEAASRRRSERRVFGPRPVPAGDRAAARRRTRRIPFFRSHPSLPLVVSAASVVIVGSVLPSTPLAHTLGFSPLPAAFFAALVAMVIGYLVLIEVGKRIFYRTTATGTRPRRRYTGERAVRRRAGRFSTSDSRSAVHPITSAFPAHRPARPTTPGASS